METKFSEIYESFLSQTSDYELLKSVEYERDELLNVHLKSAIAAFKRICMSDLSKVDFDSQQFDVSLSDEEIEILALGMLSFWVNKYVNKTDNFSVILSTPKYSYSSPSTILKELIKLKEILNNGFEREMIKYSYAMGDIDELKV